MPDTGMLEREWAEIRASGRGDGILEVPSRATAVTTGYGQVRIAIGPLGEPRLLVPVGRPAGGSATAGSHNLLLARSSFRSGGKLEHFIDITLRNPRLTRVFTELVEEILKRLESGDGPETAVHGTIQDFRNLLARTPEGEIPLTKLGGLIGELVILERLTAKLPTALDGWTGPIGQRHDFRRRSIAIEVKTSLRSDASRVTIHGPEQLLPPSNGRLHLAHVRIEPVDGGELSVAALHRAIIDYGADELVLDERLAELGCRDPQAEEWNATSFALEGIDIYALAAGFPSITPASFSGGILPAGVVALTYEIDLATAHAHLLDQAQTEVLFLEFAA
ncbi:PD-(D/E)XK motif protein [Sinorhizobium sp. 7-81]|uniref:PD-(D/E)XK motif protein n=1 Tax=Sinorhizobium sp. 8-89 TaxID=3049089 RepID=UPI0024C2EE36|nr:PD-(D/E)XK motif protein [Sinorhizobium sp. 8-89]MDK1488636.1 PD-(D/E)XK motif protein [Sinorhizobium sp. 8-89]